MLGTGIGISFLSKLRGVIYHLYLTVTGDTIMVKADDFDASGDREAFTTRDHN